MILTTSDRFLSLPCAPGYLLTPHKVPTESTRHTSTIAYRSS